MPTSSTTTIMFAHAVAAFVISIAPSSIHYKYLITLIILARLRVPMLRFTASVRLASVPRATPILTLRRKSKETRMSETTQLGYRYWTAVILLYLD